MNELLDRLRTEGFLKRFSEETLQELVSVSEWFSLPGGAALFLQREPSDKVYVVLSGRLIVVRQSGGEEDVVGYVRPGEPVGEMAALQGEEHSASVYALRDTELLALSRKAFFDLFDNHVDFAGALARLILDRSRRRSPEARGSAPRVFALVASSPSIDIEWYAETLKSDINKYGLSVCVLRDSDFNDDTLISDAAERDHDVVLLACRVGDSPWYRFVLRHADRFFVFARQDARPPSPFPLSPEPKSPARRFRLVDLVMIQEGQGRGSVTRWAEEISANRIFHWRHTASRQHLARVIAGRSTALVLSGGGARAYAHIGAVRALEEAGIPIDFVCGASMGAVIGACVAMGWRISEIEERIHDAFVESNPLGDHVLPVVALTRGRLVEDRLEKHFGDTLIEELKIPFFCISSELTEGIERVHRRGLLRHALRASVSLPGILPPVVEGDDLLVDGAVINNFPAGLMRNLHRGATIGIDVARRGSISAGPYLDPPNFVQWIRRHGFSETPPIIPLLMRSATARREQSLPNDMPDLLITPAVSGVELRDWKNFDLAIEDGYHATRSALEANKDRLLAGAV